MRPNPLVCCLLTVLAAGPSLAASSPEPDDKVPDVVNHYLINASQSAYHGRYTKALSRIGDALAIAPHHGDSIEMRARVLTEMGRFADAQADIARARAMRPGSVADALTEAQLHLFRGDPQTALAEIKALLKMDARWMEADEQYMATGHMESHIMAAASIAEQMLHQDDASVADMQRMVKVESEHPEHILTAYCYTAVMAGLLESAELACETAIDDNSHDIGQYATLGLVHLRLKEWDKAIADYTTALTARGDLTTSLYGRGLARRARGDFAGGNADIAAATAAEPDIANIMHRLGAPQV